MSKMLDFVSIKMTFYFKIRDSDIFGGEGSVGYATFSYDNMRPKTSLPPLCFEDKQLEAVKKDMADYLDVDIDKIDFVSQEEYEAETEDEEDEEE